MGGHAQTPKAGMISPHGAGGDVDALTLGRRPGMGDGVLGAIATGHHGVAPKPVPQFDHRGGM